MSFAQRMVKVKSIFIVRLLRRSPGGRWETWCGGVDCATGAGDVCKCAELCPCWWGLQWRVWSEGWCSPRISTQPTAFHHCAWSLIMRVPLWGPLGRPLCWWPCYHCWISWGMCEEALDMERSNGEERTESKCRKDKDYDLRYGTGPPAEFRQVSMRLLSHWSGQQQHLLQWLQALGAQEMQWDQALEKRPWLQMYMVPGKCMPLGWQTTKGSPGRTWQGWGGSFLLLLRRHALSSRWLWTFNHNVWKLPGRSSRICYQFSLYATSLSKHVAMCTALVCGAQCSMPVRLGHWQSQTSSVCTKMTGQWSDRSAMSDHKTLSPPGPVSYLFGLALRIWTSFWRREDSDGMDKWNAPMVQSRQPLTYRLIESMGLGGPRWHGNSWQRGIAESGSSRPSALMIDIPGDLVWDMPCVQQASYLEGGLLVWMLPLYLHVNQKIRLWYKWYTETVILSGFFIKQHAVDAYQGNSNECPVCDLTLVLLNPDIPAFVNSVDQDQLASEEANWSGSALFAIKYVNL